MLYDVYLLAFSFVSAYCTYISVRALATCDVNAELTTTTEEC